jgi:integrase
MKLSTDTLKTLVLPAGVKEKTFWDPSLPGFGVRLRATGATSFIVQYDIAGRTRKVTLGVPRSLSIGSARAQARDLLAKIRLGGDPAADRRTQRAAAAETFGALLPRYLILKQGTCRPGTFAQLEHRLQGLARPLHPQAVSTIDRRTIAALLSAIGERNGPSAAVNTHSSLTNYFAWLMGEGLLDENPMLGVNRPPGGKARERVLTEDELRALWNALGDDDYGDIVRLLVLTGCRRDEIGNLQFDEVDLDRAMLEIPAARMKGKKDHIIPLSAPALDILRRRPRDDRTHVFGAAGGGFRQWSKARAELDGRLGAPRPTYTLHDLRRVLSTGLHEMGVLPHVVEMCLAHTKHKSGTAGTYNKAQYLDERRRALARWADLVMEIVTGEKPTAEVVSIRRGA